MIDKQNYLLSLRNASKMLDVKVRTLREWIKLGKIKAIKLKDCPMWFIHIDEINNKMGK